MQSTVGEIVKDKEIPQFLGRLSASWELILIFWDAFFRQVHAACLSGAVVAEDARDLQPAQQGCGGFPPLPCK